MRKINPQCIDYWGLFLLAYRDTNYRLLFHGEGGYHEPVAKLKAVTTWNRPAHTINEL
jgi:hypothetical protein